jgi:hypothetical protein
VRGLTTKIKNERARDVIIIEAREREHVHKDSRLANMWHSAHEKYR